MLLWCSASPNESNTITQSGCEWSCRPLRAEAIKWPFDRYYPRPRLRREKSMRRPSLGPAIWAASWAVEQSYLLAIEISIRSRTDYDWRGSEKKIPNPHQPSQPPAWLRGFPWAMGHGHRGGIILLWLKTTTERLLSWFKCLQFPSEEVTHRTSNKKRNIGRLSQPLVAAHLALHLKRKSMQLHVLACVCSMYGY